MRAVLPLLFLACSAGAAAPTAGPSQAPAGFWDHWGDGQAELAGYSLVQPRYGEARDGEAVLIFVTEDLAASSLVKAETPQPDAFPVLKLNDTRDFQTGIYDYNLMTSVFVPLDGRQARGTPSKIAFSSQEWCGHVFDQIRIGDGSATHIWHSYFEGEADGQEQLDLPDGALFGDAMPLVVRDLAGPLIEPGSSREVAWWPRTQTSRFRHIEPSFQSATLSREAETREVTVPAGTFEVRRTRLEIGGRTGSWDVEAAPPHRLIAWAWSDGETGALTGTERLPYWQLNANGNEAMRTRLGLGTRPGAPRPGQSVENPAD